MPKPKYGPRTERVTPEQRTRLIAELKTKEQNSDCAALIGNLPTMRLILIWPKIELRLPDGPADYPTEVRMTVRRIWIGVEIDYEAMDEISKAARIPFTKVREHLIEAQRSCWIYPDGTVHEFAHRLSIATMARLAKERKSQKETA